MREWIYNEFEHCGVDYSDAKNAEKYDDQHQSFRNYEQELNEMIDFLGLTSTHDMSIVDIGCGTGALTVYAAKRFKRVYGVDVSEIMINQAKKKIENERSTRIDFVNAGFLTYKHSNDPVDLLVTKFALHHLPDFWKQVALFRMNRMLKLGGVLYIYDVVYNFNPMDYVSSIDGWISHFTRNVSNEIKQEVVTHIREEFSTFKWILDEMILKGGFKIEQSRSNDDFITEYHCVKVKNLPIE